MSLSMQMTTTETNRFTKYAKMKTKQKRYQTY